MLAGVFEFSEMGMEPGAELIKSDIVGLPTELQNTTGLTEAYHFKRIRYADEIPIGIENSYYPVALGEKINKYDLNKVTLYDLLEIHLGVHPKEAEQVIGAGNMEENDAELLGIPVNASVLNVDRKLIDVNGNFVEFERAHYRADMYSFKIKLARNNG
jgi:GntR family transcriptional regulator